VDARATRVRQMRVPVPGRGQVSIDVRYAGVNFKDVMARRGDAGYVSAWPFIPGVEVSGTVRELGADVGSFEVGQPVVALTNAGGLAKVAVADAAVTAAIRIRWSRVGPRPRRVH
jgi:NADPH:quinone reductase